jgi:hypothetical protein
MSIVSRATLLKWIKDAAKNQDNPPTQIARPFIREMLGKCAEACGKIVDEEVEKRRGQKRLGGEKNSASKPTSVNLAFDFDGEKANAKNDSSAVERVV